MDAQDLLLTFAEVAVALAGFIGITAAFRRRESSWSVQDITSVRFVLEVSFCALFLSFLPGLVINLGLSAELAWRLASVIMALALLALFVFQSLRRARLVREHGTLRSLAARPLLLGVYLSVTAGIFICGLFGFVVQGVYLAGITMLLISAAIEFLVFVAGLQE